MSKYIQCEQCNTSLGEIKEGSKLRKDVVYLCRICYNKCVKTQTSGSVGMRRLAGYVKDALSGIDWVDEIPYSEPYRWETFEEYQVSDAPDKHYPDVIFNAARELKE